MMLGRFLYFLLHPSEYLGLLTLDLTLVTVGFSFVTLLVVLKQLLLMTEQSRLMRHQDTLMQRQTDVVVRQDETNRELLARRAKLYMYPDGPVSARLIVGCRNDGNKTAQNFYWHLSVPDNAGCQVWDPTGSFGIPSSGHVLCDDVQCVHFSGLVRDPLYPTRKTPVAIVQTTNPKNLRLWWSTISEDGPDPMPDGEMQRMERGESGSELLTN
jgi:hypothetical protein